MRRFVLVLCLIAGTAHADREAAGIHFQAAQAAEKRGDWKTAIAEYEQAYKLAPEPSVRFNMGRAYEELGENRRAAEMFELYLRGNAKAEDRDQVLLRITGLRERPSKLRVAEPPGAVVIVDGVSRGPVPLELELPAGVHEVSLEETGPQPGRSATQQITAEYGEPLVPTFVIVPDDPPPPPHVRGALSFGAGLGVHSALGSEWGGGAALSFSGRLRGTFAPKRKLRAFVELGATIGPAIEDDRIGLDLGPKERFILFNPRVGVSVSVWQRGRARLDAFGAVSLVAGYHSLSLGLDQLAKQGVTGFGGGGGIEFVGGSQKSERQQWFASLGYYVVPSSVGDDTGFRSTGIVDLGGVELSIGWAVLIGKPSTSVRGRDTWSASR
jgi:hypothetical protein